MSREAQSNQDISANADKVTRALLEGYRTEHGAAAGPALSGALAACVRFQMQALPETSPAGATIAVMLPVMQAIAEQIDRVRKDPDRSKAAEAQGFAGMSRSTLDEAIAILEEAPFPSTLWLVEGDLRLTTSAPPAFSVVTVIPGAEIIGASNPHLLELVRQALGANTKAVAEQLEGLPDETGPGVYRHADGGLYVLIERGSLKLEDGRWSPSVSYRPLEGGVLATTTERRWLERFTLLSAAETAEVRPGGPSSTDAPFDVTAEAYRSSEAAQAAAYEHREALNSAEASPIGLSDRERGDRG